MKGVIIAEERNYQDVLKTIDEKLADKPQYRKMVNNLLEIEARDSAIFVSIKGNGYGGRYDLKNLLSEADFRKVFHNKNLNLEIINQYESAFINRLRNAENLEHLLELCKDANYKVSSKLRQTLENHFAAAKMLFISSLKTKDEKWISKWKRFITSYLDKQAQTNTWPLYIGTMFFKVKTENSVLHAPLILKKVAIEIYDDRKVELKSVDDSVEINEKLLFLLQNEYNFTLPKLSEESKYSFHEAIALFSKAFENIVGSAIDFQGKMEHLTKKDVENRDLRYASGVVLAVFSPSGGKLRDKLLDLVKNTDLDEILDVDQIRNIKGEIDKQLENRGAIYRINQTDFSQEKAIFGAFKDNAIIWGPPGTGKSQTIANIIANLMVYDASALITSEKKAALDVIQKRMGKLAKYMFFGLTDKKIDKHLFYKPFRDLVTTIEERQAINPLNPTTLHTTPNWDYIKLKNLLQNKDLSEITQSLDFHFSERQLAGVIKQNWNFLKSHKDLLVNFDQKKSTEENLESLGIKKRGWWIFKKYPQNINYLQNFLLQYDPTYRISKFLVRAQNENDVLRADTYLQVEQNYCLQSRNFRDDSDYLDELMANKFAKRIQQLRQDEKTAKAINLFLKNSRSGWRIPYKFIAIHKRIIDQLFNIFVSTPQTLANIVSLKRTYDFALFDEASQLHLEKAIPFLSVAKRSIIAGDSQQMRPTSAFARRDNTELDDDYDENVDSLLDFAYRRGLGAREYMLTKNYRSKSAELMLFSSKTFYESKLDVVDSLNYANQKAIEVYEVGGVWKDNANTKEGYLVLQKLLELKRFYKKIIILTFNAKQRDYIMNQISESREFNDINYMFLDGSLYLRNLENIQGDEADLVLVSVAYDKNARLSATYVGRPEGKNALNVAISRAISKMIVFKSIHSDEILKTTNESLKVFKDWLAYLEKDQKSRRNYLVNTSKVKPKFTSKFEKEVFEYLSKNLLAKEKMYMSLRYSLGSYTIDLALINHKTHEFVLGIEIDSYEENNSFKMMTKDIERQNFIMAKGFPIYRVTELNWKWRKGEIVNEINNKILRWKVNSQKER